jgi:hypothetical protein
MKAKIIGVSVAAFCAIGSVNNVRADDGLGSKLAGALSGIVESAVGGLQEAVTGMGPGGNKLNDVTHTATFKVDQTKNEEGIQTINYFGATDSELDQVKVNQFVSAKSIENTRGIQRINTVMFNDSHVRNTTIDQVSKIAVISNSEGIQQINTVSINHAQNADKITITQTAEGKVCTNSRGVQTINRTSL